MKMPYILNFIFLLHFFVPQFMVYVALKEESVGQYAYWKQWLIDQESKYEDVVQSSENASTVFLDTLGKKRFFLGVSTSAYQYEGGYDKVLDENGLPADAIERYALLNGLATPAHAVDLWDDYETFIAKIKEELGVNAMRISIGWSRVEPDEGNFNQEAIDRYIGIVKCMQNHGIEPIICFHHYANPQWFMEKGDFSKENNACFVKFCLTVGDQLIEHGVKYYLPINGIQSYGLRAYFNGDQVPYGRDIRDADHKENKKNLQKAMEVTACILDAHVQVYHGLKEIYRNKVLENSNIQEPQIGLFVVYHPLDPVTNTWKQKLFYGITKLACQMGNDIQNPGVFEFFKTGVFSVDVGLDIAGRKIRIPGHIARVYNRNKNAKGTVDFIALSAYANRPMVAFSKYMDDISEYQKTGSKNYYACPQMIYRATQYAYREFSDPMQKLYGKEIPIMIMENGISTQNEAQRDWYYKQVTISIIRALKDGYPLVGYFPWTATDCFEWRSGKVHTYGLISATFEHEVGNEDGRPVLGFIKEGAKFWASFIKNAVKRMNNRC